MLHRHWKKRSKFCRKTTISYHRYKEKGSKGTDVNWTCHSTYKWNITLVLQTKETINIKTEKNFPFNSLCCFLLYLKTCCFNLKYAVVFREEHCTYRVSSINNVMVAIYRSSHIILDYLQVLTPKETQNTRKA